MCLVVFWVLSDSSEWILVVVSDEVLLHSSAWPEINSVDQVGCKLTEIPLPLPPGNWVCTTMPSLWCVHGVMSSDLFLCGGEISCQLLNNLIVCVGTFSWGVHSLISSFGLINFSNKRNPNSCLGARTGTAERVREPGGQHSKSRAETSTFRWVCHLSPKCVLRKIPRPPSPSCSWFPCCCSTSQGHCPLSEP